MPGGALTKWAERLRAEAADTFPEKTALRPGMRCTGAMAMRVRDAARKGTASASEQRDQLLRAMPDGRPAARRPRLFATATRRLAVQAL